MILKYILIIKNYNVNIFKKNIFSINNKLPPAMGGGHGGGSYVPTRSALPDLTEAAILRLHLTKAYYLDKILVGAAAPNQIWLPTRLSQRHPDVPQAAAAHVLIFYSFNS